MRVVPWVAWWAVRTVCSKVGRMAGTRVDSMAGSLARRTVARWADVSVERRVVSMVGLRVEMSVGSRAASTGASKAGRRDETKEGYSAEL